MNRREIANRLISEIKSYCGEKGRIWEKNGLVRVYLRKGYASITEDGKLDVSTVGGIAFMQGIALRAQDAGIKVIGQEFAK